MLRLTLTLVLAPFAFAAQAEPHRPPNIVFILCDDLGWGDLGVLHQNSVEGAKRLYTPHLDRLASEGRILRQHYCPAPVCAPSRASLLTGVHQGHATIRDNQFDKALEDAPTIPSVLREAGYATALIGKYGLQGKGGDGPATWPAYPTKRGFDTFYGYVRHRDGHSHYPAHETAARKPMQLWDGENEVSKDLTGCYTTDLFTARAKRFMVEQVENDAPFFLLLTYDTPHAALHVPTQAYPEGLGVEGGVQWVGEPGRMINTASSEIDGWLDPRVRDTDWTEGAKRFATMVHRIDDAVGDLMATLRDLDLADSTLIVFTSDNGPHKEAYTRGRRYDASEFDSFGPFDGIKRDVLEGGIRVPTIAWWAGEKHSSRIDDGPSQFHDWMATFCDVAGVPVPARSDGVSLVLGPDGTREPSTVYVEYAVGGKTPGYDEFDPSHRQRKRGQQQVVFLEGYKGVRVQIESHDDPFEIYDVAADPRETRNLARSSPAFAALAERMRDRALRVRRPNGSAKRPYDDATVRAVGRRPTSPGLEYASFVGEWPWLPEFERMAPAATGATASPALEGVLSEGSSSGALYTGLIDVPASGTWTFELDVDGDAILRLHDARVIEIEAGGRAAAVVRMSEGLHPVRLYYATDGEAPRLSLRWAEGAEALTDVPTETWRR